MRSLWACCLFAAFGCGGRSGLETPTGYTEAACDPSKPFGTPVPIAGVPACDATFTQDERTVYFSTSQILYGATRPNVHAPFRAPSKLLEAAPGLSRSPALSSDGLTLFFQGQYACDTGGQLCYEIFVTTRLRASDGFGKPTLAPGVNDLAIQSRTNTFTPFVTADGEWLYLAWDDEPDPFMKNHLWRSRRSGSVWSTPEALSELSDKFRGETSPVVSPDHRVIYFYGGPSAGDDDGVWFATREDSADRFASPKQIKGLERRKPAWLSPDGCRLYVTDWSGGCRLSVATR